MITDLVQIRRLGDKMRDENLRFRRHLKVHHYNERKFRKIAQDIEAGIDCTACANCCRVAAVPMQERDVEKLAKFLGMSAAKFNEQYVEIDDEGEPVLRRTPEGCVFLSGNECTVYEARPSNCMNFPHVVRGEGPISTRMWQFVDRACYCPIVFNSIEAFKKEAKFRR